MQFLKAVLKITLLGISTGGLPSMEDFVPPPAFPPGCFQKSNLLVKSDNESSDV